MASTECSQQLIDAVLHVTVEQRVHKVSINSVAKAAGVSSPVVYEHFADINQLLRASLDHEVGEVIKQIFAITSRLCGDDPARRIADCLEGFLNAACSTEPLESRLYDCR
ncbi:TetR/AcrR family transcriptional regulator [Mycobacteroides abscessus]|uniref:TetR/AcrR family transcriptional regulator n=1 Tax=Mycobacteroides abscessus TaxID=36809 RepID=UPI0039BE1EB0